jgi:collagen type III alpha
MRVLDLHANVDASAVKQAYRKLALKHHPDKHRGDPDAERRFREIVRAYDTLAEEACEEADSLREELRDKFESAADMRDFAASFFESFFFGGAGFDGGRGSPFSRRGRYYDGDASSRDYDDEDDSLSSLDDYDDDDDYTDDDEEYTDLHNFFGNEPPPGWGGRSGFGSKWFGRLNNSQREGRGERGGPSMTDDQLFEHLEQMRKEAARYATELAKQENEARRANEPLEKLQRPTLVSRTDNSITLNLSRTKSTSQTLPQDRCWELSMKKEKDHSFSVHSSLTGKAVITVDDLLPGTKYCFKSRVGRVEESSGKVTEWGPHSVESAYVTSGRAPVANSGKASAKGETEDPVEAGKGKKAKKRAAKEQAEKEERERAAAAQKEGTAESAAEEAAARQAALRKAAEEAAEREMAEMEAIRKRVEAAKKPEVKAAASAGEGISKKAAQRKKKKERAKAEELAREAEVQNSSTPAETDEELARRLQAEEDRSMLNKRQASAQKPPPPSGPPPSWAAAPAMRMPVKTTEQNQQAFVRAPPPSGPPPGAQPPPPQSAPPPGQSRIPTPRAGDDGRVAPPLPPGPRPQSAYNVAPPLPTAQRPQASSPPQNGGAWGGGQSSGIAATSTWGESHPGAPMAQPPPPAVAAAPAHAAPSQPASWSPANSNWQPMGQGMGALPVGDVFATDSQLPGSGGLFSGGLEQNWAPTAAPTVTPTAAPTPQSAQWGEQNWNAPTAAPVQQGVPADWGLGGLNVNADLNPGSSNWGGAFAGTPPSTTPGVWSNAPNDLSVDIGRVNLDGRPQTAAQRSPGTPEGDPNLIDSSLLSFLG